mgnify:CR=1 FL=1
MEISLFCSICPPAREYVKTTNTVFFMHGTSVWYPLNVVTKEIVNGAQIR